MTFGPVATFFFTFLVLSCAITPSYAQTSKIFQWGFAGSVRVFVVVGHQQLNTFAGIFLITVMSPVWDRGQTFQSC
jgi:hypothetical protein